MGPCPALPFLPASEGPWKEEVQPLRAPRAVPSPRAPGLCHKAQGFLPLKAPGATPELPLCLPLGLGLSEPRCNPHSGPHGGSPELLHRDTWQKHLGFLCPIPQGAATQRGLTSGHMVGCGQSQSPAPCRSHGPPPSQGCRRGCPVLARLCSCVVHLPGGPGGPRGPGTPASTVSTAPEASCASLSVGRAEGPVTGGGHLQGWGAGAGLPQGQEGRHPLPHQPHSSPGEQMLLLPGQRAGKVQGAPCKAQTPS